MRWPGGECLAAHGAAEGRGVRRSETATPEAHQEEDIETEPLLSLVGNGNRSKKRKSPSLLARAFSVSRLKETHLTGLVGTQQTWAHNDTTG